MKVLVLLAVALLASCAPESGAQNADQPHRFRYEGEFYPAFHPECRIVIQADEGHGHLKLTLANNLVSTSAAASDSVPLTAADLARFYASLDSVPLLDLVTNIPFPPGSDGITVYNTVTQDGKQNDFQFWSPPRNSPEDRVAKAVLGLARRKCTHPRQQAYFKDVGHYFE